MEKRLIGELALLRGGKTRLRALKQEYELSRKEHLRAAGEATEFINLINRLTRETEPGDDDKTVAGTDTDTVSDTVTVDSEEE